MQHVGAISRDDVSPAPNQDHISTFSQSQDRFRSMSHKHVGGGMCPKQLIHHVVQFRSAVLGHESREAAWQLMLREDIPDEVVIE
jgi:hypothetical protein